MAEERKINCKGYISYMHFGSDSDSEPVITINLENGSVTFGKGYSADETANYFWSRVEHLAKQYIENQRKACGLG